NLINNSKCAILWVSFGCPKQELWIVSNIDKLRIPVSIGVGAAFDFHSGVVKRASLFMQNIKLEWLYRFFQDPKRLWRRYFIGGLSFAKTVIKQKFSKKK
ncbi:MAG TPA: WecB/TagA/CpsF family glycosyltransferase, partial [Spirochaetota bacterium]|nr:WecB/TagA/CpsF family glycosyltransferase [Spirochaetota bacterium]